MFYLCVGSFEARNRQPMISVRMRVQVGSLGEWLARQASAAGRPRPAPGTSGTWSPGTWQVRPGFHFVTIPR